MSTICQQPTSKIEIFHGVSEIPESKWSFLTETKNIYLTLPYLKALEDAMRDKMDFYYALSIDEHGEPLVAAAFQLVEFKDKRNKYSEHLCKISKHVERKIREFHTINVLVCGNVYSDGENGYIWSDKCDAEFATEEVDRMLEEMKKDKSIREKASVTLFKEFWSETSRFSDILLKRNYREFMIDVNMVLKVHSAWKGMDDYLDSMKTKFRTRAKSVFKKSESLEVRRLTVDEIKNESAQIEQLFSNVLSKSDFSVGALSVEAFVNMKQNLGDRFTLTGLYQNGVLVGFSTSTRNRNWLEANFVGINYDLNNDLCIYQRLLFDFVEQALEAGVEELHLGRTAELMKSQIGALPNHMKLYVKHRSFVPNLLLKPIVQSISPSQFELREPFKADFTY